MLGDDPDNAVPLQSYELALLSRAASDAVTLAPWQRKWSRTESTDPLLWFSNMFNDVQRCSWVVIFRVSSAGILLEVYERAWNAQWDWQKYWHQWCTAYVCPSLFAANFHCDKIWKFIVTPRYPSQRYARCHSHWLGKHLATQSVQKMRLTQQISADCNRLNKWKVYISMRYVRVCVCV